MNENHSFGSFFVSTGLETGHGSGLVYSIGHFGFNLPVIGAKPP